MDKVVKWCIFYPIDNYVLPKTYNWNFIRWLSLYMGSLVYDLSDEKKADFPKYRLK